jgi:hypothetical protein
MPFDYADMKWVKGTPNAPGIREGVFFIPKVHIAEWATLKEAPLNAVESSTLEGDFVLVEGKTWFTLETNQDKSPLSCEAQGEDDSKTFLNKLTLKYAGTNEEAATFAKMANNDDMVFIVQTKFPLRYRVIGSNMWRTRVNVSLNLGAAPTEEIGTTIEIACTDIIPAPYYNGSIITSDGEQNPSGSSL